MTCVLCDGGESGDRPSVSLNAAASGPGELLLGFSVYPTWSTAVVTIAQAEDFVKLLQSLIEASRPQQQAAGR